MKPRRPLAGADLPRQSTAETAHKINRAVRAEYDAEEAIVASVVGLSFVPPAYWITVSLMLGQVYEKATAELPPGADPADYVRILAASTEASAGAGHTGRRRS